MIVKIHTLVDITKTDANRTSEPKERNQQANYNTFLATAGLRVNPEKISVKNDVFDISKMGFGDKYINKQKVWTFRFEHQYEDGLDIEMLLDDFDVIPIITGLNETVEINKSVVRTRDPFSKNIVFEIGDEQE